MAVGETAVFAHSRQRFEETVSWLAGTSAGGLSHAALEQRLEVVGRELLRRLLQDHLDLRAVREERLPAVLGQDKVARAHAERGHQRTLSTVFGQVGVTRIGYRAKGEDSRFPVDAVLNLPAGLHSHGLCRLAAVEAARGSFEQAAAAIERSCGVSVGKRQVEALAAAASHKLVTRLSRGEKLGRKRMAEVVAVYHCTPVPDTPADVIATPGGQRGVRRDGPKAVGKWLHASVTDDTACVIAAMFDQAQCADPHARRPWVVPVDGNIHQISLIRARARARDRPVAIIVDFMHVLEYLWKAAWCFHREGDPAIEDRVWLDPDRRKGADACVAYLLNKLRALTGNGDFDTYWTWHLEQKHQRVHASRYLASTMPS